MRSLSVFTPLRQAIQEAEQVASQAWEKYHSTISPEALEQAIEYTRCSASLHRQLAHCLEQVVDA